MRPDTSDQPQPSHPMPRFIEIETSTKCNRRCGWCPTGLKETGDSQSLMLWPTFKSIIDQLSDANFAGWLALHNFNEPLLNPRIYDEIAYATSKIPGCTVSIFTNGDYLTQTIFDDLINAGMRHLRVTLYPRSEHLSCRSSEQAEFRVAEWITRRQIVRFSDIVFSTPRATRRGFEQESMVGRCKVHIVVPVVELAYSNRAATVEVGMRRKRTQPCSLTETSAAIDSHGRLKMCCDVSLELVDVASYSIGDAAIDGLLPLWHSERMVNLRRRHAAADWTESAVCENCTRASSDSESA